MSDTVTLEFDTASASTFPLPHRRPALARARLDARAVGIARRAVCAVVDRAASEAGSHRRSCRRPHACTPRSPISCKAAIC